MRPAAKQTQERLARRLRQQAVMRVSSSAKLVAATWLAALIGALAGHSLAEASAAPSSESATTVAAGARSP